ncbi:MAG: hypothetical protein C0406_10630 [Sideroxydans sp.]|nr:hypothetical protein [Sideroxydans sp.]
MKRQKIPQQIVVQVLTEAGYRCASPTCRNILAIDIHHIIEVSEGGGSEPTNLIALCPTCHRLYHNKTISQDSIYTWKAVLVSLSQAFDKNTVDNLLFLSNPNMPTLRLSGDGVLHFALLIASGLASFQQVDGEWAHRFYSVSLTQKGCLLLEAWKAGNRDGVALSLSSPNT